MSISYGSALVVNDVEINLVVAQELLESYKLQVDTADNGFTAFDKIKSGNIYDIVFMDNMMPGMDGIETTEKIRETGYTGKIVLLTGNVGYSDYDNRLFDGFLLNPIDSKKLEVILNEFIPIIAMSEPPQSKSDKSRLMRAFRRDAEKAIAELQKRPCDPFAYAATFHSMKTALANIGHEEESELALKLEKAGKSGDVNYVTEHVDSLINILVSLSHIEEGDSGNSANGKDTQNSGGEKVAEDAEFISQNLNIIKSACDEYDIGEVEKVFNILLGTESEEKPLKNSTREFLEEMRDLVYNDSDFDTVSEKITEFIKEY